MRSVRIQPFICFGDWLFLSIGRPTDRKNDDSVSLQEVLEPHYIHGVDEKTDVVTDVDTDVDLKLLPHSHLIDIWYKVMKG